MKDWKEFILPYNGEIPGAMKKLGLTNLIRMSIDPKHAAFFREFCRGTQEVEMDTNGRILLPRKMLDEIGIDKEMVLAAQDSMIQVWDARVYGEVAISGKELGAMAEEIFKN